MRTLVAKSHPLIDGPVLRATLQTIASAEASRALAETASWLESLVGNTLLDQAERLRLLFALDEACVPACRDSTDRYLCAAAAGLPEKRALWAQTRGHWALLLEAYSEALIAVSAEMSAPSDTKSVDAYCIAELCARAIRAATCRSKWDGFLNAQFDDSLWARLNLAYRLAVAAGSSQQALKLHPSSTAETTVEREYTRAFALYTIGLDQLDAARLELASHVVEHVLPYLELSPTPNQASSAWVDAALPCAPLRLVKCPKDLRLPRFFSGVAAVPFLDELLHEVAHGKPISGVASDGEQGHGRAASALSHIVRAWSNDQPTRRYRRYVLPGTMLVIDGMNRFVSRLSGADDVMPLRWAVRDASMQGVSADAPFWESRQVQVGSLIGMHSPDGDRWRVGAVRRVWRASDELNQVGIELLGGTPVPASADDGAAPCKVLLLEPLRHGQAVRIAVPVPGTPRAGVALYVVDRGKTIKLTPLTTIEYGVDYEIRAYMYAG